MTFETLKPGITLAVPAFNEEKRLAMTLKSLADCLKKLPDLDAEIIVINDGSSDATAEIANAEEQINHRVRVLHHATNLGLGRCIRDAIEMATRDRFMIVPGDNDMPSKMLERMFIQSRKAEMVMCYFLDVEKRSFFRNFLSAVFGLIYMGFFKIHVQYINGPCVYPTSRLQGLKLRSTRFSIVAEINVKLLRSGVSFTEISAVRQNGDEGSKAIRLANLIETIATFIHLFMFINLNRVRPLNKAPIRINIE